MFALVFFTTNAFIIYFSHYTSRDIVILIKEYCEEKSD